MCSALVSLREVSGYVQLGASVYIRRMTQTPQNLITRKQAADRAGVHPRTIDRYRRSGLLKTYTFRGLQTTVWIDAEELDVLLHPAVLIPAQKQGADA